MRTLVAVLAACGLALGLAALVRGSTPQATGVAHFREQQISHFSTADGPGGVEVWRSRVLLTGKRQAVGTGVAACVRVEEHSSILECQATYILPRGRIQLAGEIVERASYQLTIVGGSGIYAAGAGVAVFFGAPSAQITFYLNSR